jgi:hypothetical protein
VALSNAAYMAFNYKGFFYNESMGACFNACLLPFFWKKGTFNRVATAMILFSTFLSHKNQPVAVAAVALGALFILEKRFKVLLALPIVAASAGKFITGTAFLAENGRIEVWKDSIHFLRDHFNQWIGSGLGTYYYIGPFLTLKKLHEAFVWLHSDWLQIWFETGWIGLLLATAFFTHTLIKARKNTPLCASLVAFGFFGIANFPLHNAISGLYFLFLIRWALCGEERKA